MKNGDVVSIVTFSGEYVGKLSEDNGTTIVLEDPKMLVSTPEGMGFAKGICVTGEEDVKEVTFQQYAFVTPSNKQIKDAYLSAVSGIQLNSGGIVT